jgi:hypothetical protein
VVVLGSVVALRARSADPAPEPARGMAASSTSALLDSLADHALPVAPSSTPASAGESRRQILSKTTLDDAIAVARPQMVNTVGRVDTGSALLAVWAAGHLTWEMLEAAPTTTAAMFHKDPESERGKRLCINGTIVEIRAEKSLAARMVDDRALPLITARPYAAPTAPPAFPGDIPGARRQEPGGASSLLPAEEPPASDWAVPDDGKVFIATLREKAQSSAQDSVGHAFRKSNRDELVVEIIAAKSSGQLVARSDARACGILTGVTLPSTKSSALPADVTEHRIVGMFDLPQNRVGH